MAKVMKNDHFFIPPPNSLSHNQGRKKHGADILTKIEISCSDIISYWVGSRLDHQAALNKFESQLEKFPLDIFQPLSCAITFDKIANLPSLVRLVSFISAHSSICRERRLGEIVKNTHQKQATSWMRRSGSYQKFNTRGILFVWHEETVGGEGSNIIEVVKAPH